VIIKTDRKKPYIVAEIMKDCLTLHFATKTHRYIVNVPRKKFKKLIRKRIFEGLAGRAKFGKVGKWHFPTIVERAIQSIAFHVERYHPEISGYQYIGKPDITGSCDYTVICEGLKEI
jgi:hypothetical protein